MSLPARQPSTSAPMTSGGCWRSASIGITASPRAWSSPAVSAISLPNLRESSTTRIRGSRSRAVSIATSDASRLPSSTNTISHGNASASSAALARATKASMLAASSCTGTTSDSTGGGCAAWLADGSDISAAGATRGACAASENLRCVIGEPRALAARQRDMPRMHPSLEAVDDIRETGASFGEVGRVDLRDIAEAHDLGAGTCARDQRLHLLGRQVLRFVDDQELVDERTPAHEVEALDLDPRADQGQEPQLHA